MPTDFGPQYCETPGMAEGFPVEPWNTWSSGVIVLWGLAALLLVMRRSPRDLTLYALCALLIVNGVGSMLWHGLRTRWALSLDALPAVVFVIIVAVVWARKVAPLWQAAMVGVLLVALPVALFRFDIYVPGLNRLLTAAIVVAAAGVWLVARTYFVSPGAYLIGGFALASASAALTFRMVDPLTCDQLSFGTHFLWHIFLSTAAFLCMVTLVRLRASNAHPPPL
ncbi:MAG: hypothetical protein GC190_18290 [Alphaproteobacteria bacterium]|nr:hypothetical protein [Alphaproteobacteria bacterium]